MITKYIRTLLYLLGKSNISKPMVAKIIVNLYLINNLKANLLLGTNVIGSKKINVITSKKYIYMGSYNMRVPIKVNL